MLLLCGKDDCVIDSNVTKEQCSICLEENNNCSICTTECGHRFHRSCLQDWTRAHNTCPMCRSEIKTINDLYHKIYAFMYEMCLYKT